MLLYTSLVLLRPFLGPVAQTLRPPFYRGVAVLVFWVVSCPLVETVWPFVPVRPYWVWDLPHRHLLFLAVALYLVRQGLLLRDPQPVLEPDRREFLVRLVAE